MSISNNNLWGDAFVSEETFSIKVLRIGKKSVTKALIDQMPVNLVFDENENLLGTIHGYINNGNGIKIYIWSNENGVYKFNEDYMLKIAEKYIGLITAKDKATRAGYSSSRNELYSSFKSKLSNVEQLYIGV